MKSLRSRLRRWLGIDSADSTRLAIVEDVLTAIVPRIEELEAGALTHADAAQRLAYYEIHSGALSHWRAKLTKQRTS